LTLSLEKHVFCGNIGTNVTGRGFRCCRTLLPIFFAATNVAGKGFQRCRSFWECEEWLWQRITDCLF